MRCYQCFSKHNDSFTTVSSLYHENNATISEEMEKKSTDESCHLFHVVSKSLASEEKLIITENINLY